MSDGDAYPQTQGSPGWEGDSSQEGKGITDPNPAPSTRATPGAWSRDQGELERMYLISHTCVLAVLQTGMSLMAAPLGSGAGASPALHAAEKRWGRSP